MGHRHPRVALLLSQIGKSWGQNNRYHLDVSSQHGGNNFRARAFLSNYAIRPRRLMGRRRHAVSSIARWGSSCRCRTAPLGLGVMIIHSVFFGSGRAVLESMWRNFRRISLLRLKEFLMPNPDHLAELKKGVDAWNQWRRSEPDTKPDLVGANFAPPALAKATYRKQTHVKTETLKGRSRFAVRRQPGVKDLRFVDLSDANLTGADLSGAILLKAVLIKANLTAVNLSTALLIGAYISEANLTSAKLTGASLFGADLAYSNLSGADLRGADLLAANLTGAVLERANVAGARISGTTFADVDLSGVVGLESVFHEGPSSIGIDTFLRSSGKIPDIFLRGCGVPQNIIEYMASLVGTGIEFYSLFISYSSKDQKFAERLHADLQAKGVRCWFAPEDMPGGKKLHEEIDAAIRMHDKLLLILSEHSMNSQWVRTEISKARKRETQEEKRGLFPIRLCSFEELRDWECFDADMGKDSAREIREYFIPDFSDWKHHDAYKDAFDRLLRDLQSKS